VILSLLKQSCQYIGVQLYQGERGQAVYGRAIQDEHASPVIIRPLGQPGDLGWVVQAHGELYAQEFGWDTSFEALVARIVADYAGHHHPHREAAWIAEVDGKRVGCVLCVAADETTAKLRILLVHPTVRGQGVGRRLVETCLNFARAAGYRRITLWTNNVLVSARRIYEATGFELIDEQRHHSFGHNLVGQNWARDL
jgi:GNAT superfamily N-acetyltransferase